MRDHADVRLVNAHPKRNRRDDDSVPANEPVLNRLPVVRLQAGVVGSRFDPVQVVQLLRHFLRLLLRRDVDDRCAVTAGLERRNENRELGLEVGARLDRDREAAGVRRSASAFAQVQDRCNALGTEGTGGEDALLAVNAEAVRRVADVGDDGRRCGRRQAEDALGSDLFREARDLEIFGAEGWTCRRVWLARGTIS